MQPANALLPREGFVPERLLAPHQAVVAYFSRVETAEPAVETVPIDASSGRVLARPVAAGDDYPNAARSAMDGFAVVAAGAPATFRIVADVAMGAGLAKDVAPGEAARIPTGGVIPPGADAVVPIEDARVDGDSVTIERAVARGESVIDRGADMRSGEIVLRERVRIGARHAGVLATLGIVDVPVFRKPVVAVLSSGDEIVPADARPEPGQVRDSNRFAVAASLRAMGADVRHQPTLRDEAGAFDAGLRAALAECDAAVITGGSSVGERDRLPYAVAALGEPGVVVHGLRVKPGKPMLLGALGRKPIIGLPGNPTSAIIMLEAVGAPILAALTGAPVTPNVVRAVLAEPLTGRPGWTWYVPVALRDDAGTFTAHPLALRSFSVSLTARADGYVVIGERDAARPAGTTVEVVRFLGG